MYFILWGKSKDYLNQLVNEKNIGRVEAELPVIAPNSIKEESTLRSDSMLIVIQMSKMENQQQNG